MRSRPGKVRIGTSNIVIPGNKQSFPPAYQLRSRLHYYSSLFNTVEVNSCFYKTPLFSTYQKWSLDVPDDFRFSLKLSREITHAKDLQSDLACMEKFIESAAGTGNKRGCLLIQFPGKITLEYFKQVEQILSALQDLEPGLQWRKAVEFRNITWYAGETWELLDEYGAAMVLQDMPRAKIMEPRGKAPFIYLRFHGPRGDYRGGYTDDFLRSMANDIKTWTDDGKDVYAYFNNTIGNAFDNAISLKAMTDL